MTAKGKIKYKFSAKIWKPSNGSWHFGSLPKNMSSEIRQNLKWQEEGWGRLSAQAKIDEFEWKTAIWFDTKMGCYLLPVKADIRKKAGLKENQMIDILIWI
jgi:hypothetical protein